MATLGVSDDDWRYLGNRALEKLNIEVAKKAYVRIRDVRLLNLCDEVGEKVRRGERGRNTIGADVLALQGDLLFFYYCYHTTTTAMTHYFYNNITLLVKPHQITIITISQT